MKKPMVSFPRLPRVVLSVGMAALFGSLAVSAHAILLLGSNVSAAEIYSQTFTGGTSTLAGTTSTTGGGTWTGRNILDLNGNTYRFANGGHVALPFTPSNGFVYDLSATINVTAAQNWLGVGFLRTNNTYTYEMAALRRTGGWENYPVGNASLTSSDVLIRLDTRGAQWTTSFFQGGVQMGSTYTYTSGNPTITYVGFVEDILDITGNVSAFQLTAVPEPSTYAMALAGLACGGYSLFRRRRDR